MTKKFSRTFVIVAWLISLIIMLCLGLFAGKNVLQGPRQKVSETNQAPATTTAIAGKVGKTIPTSIEVAWQTIGTIRATSEGTITKLSSDQIIKSGSIIYEIDLHPVYVFLGETPMFRDIGPGTKGRDITQLRHALAASGFGYDSESDTFDTNLSNAIYAWQRSVGFTATGVVTPADISFAPQLPARVKPAENVHIGTHTSAGTDVMIILNAEPSFKLVMHEEQAKQVPDQGAVEISGPQGKIWSAQLGERHNEEIKIVVSLTGVQNASVCAEGCAAISSTTTQLLGKIIVIPESSGISVPRSAVRVSDQGKAEVILPDGTVTPVTVIADASGKMIIEGISAGTVIRLIAHE
ncbi:MAG: peptidoglycan-binding domain-containing protein [Propionibacteriaceae bacterium]